MEYPLHPFTFPFLPFPHHLSPSPVLSPALSSFVPFTCSLSSIFPSSISASASPLFFPSLPFPSPSYLTSPLYLPSPYLFPSSVSLHIIPCTLFPLSSYSHLISLFPSLLPSTNIVSPQILSLICPLSLLFHIYFSYSLFLLPSALISPHCFHTSLPHHSPLVVHSPYSSFTYLQPLFPHLFLLFVVSPPICPHFLSLLPYNIASRIIVHFPSFLIHLPSSFFLFLLVLYLLFLPHSVH